MMTFEFCVDNIESTNLKKLKFYTSTKKHFSMSDSGFLHVTFQNNSRYIYENVSFGEVWNLINADSMGETFNAAISKRYKYEKVS